MIQLNFANAVAEDDGYGLKVNGKPLEDMISLALGTVCDISEPWGNTTKTGKHFRSKLCNIQVTIEDKSDQIKETVFFSNKEGRKLTGVIPIKDYEEALTDEYLKKDETGDTEE